MLVLQSRWTFPKCAWQLQACPYSPGVAQQASCSWPGGLAA